MLDRGFRKNAVPQIEDERAIGKRLENVLDLTVEHRSSNEQDHRVEITLDRDVSRDLVAREAAVDRPVEADGLNRNLLDVSRQGRADATGKADDSCFRPLRT